MDGTAFGSITIEGQTFRHDVLIRLDGDVRKRKKKLSKAVYGTSHKVSLTEARHVYEQGADRVVIGTGQHGALELSDEAAEYLQRQGCAVHLLPTEEAIKYWNESNGLLVGLFHVTC